MTLIAAIIDNKKTVHMIGDRRTTNDSGDIMTRDFAKVAVLTPTPGQDKLIIGACGNIELATACAHLFIPPPLPEDKSDLAFYRWSLNEMRLKIREMLTQHNLFRKDKDGEQELPGMILIAARGRILRFERKVIPMAIQRSYWAIGGGEDYCIGAIHTMLKHNSTPPTAKQCKQYLIDSMRTVVELKTNVGAPFDYVNTEGAQEVIEK